MSALASPAPALAPASPPALSLSQLEQVLHALPHALLVLDEAGGVVFGNDAARLLLGGDATGRPLDQSAAPAPPGANGLRRLVSLSGEVVETRALALPWGGRLLELGPVSGEAATGFPRDELTGLATRNEILSVLSDALGRAEAPGSTPVLVLCLDLDRFKIVNDTLGHAIGDLLLRKVAGRLRSACRAGDLVGRLGGDEFVVQMADASSLGDAEALAARLVDLIARTYVVAGHTINIGVSIGLAAGTGAIGAEALLRHADLALFEAKKAGRGRFLHFVAGMDEALRERRELEVDLRRALALRQFALHFQPLVDLTDGTVTGFEALLRWTHPVRGTIAPLSFIPLAEETGFIVPIGEWVLNTACRAAMNWPGNLNVAVNVSPVQFRSGDLLSTVVSALANSGLPASRLELEITESCMLQETEGVLRTLHALSALGVRISMDDFGTGYSSLSYLQKFPFDKIKIDRSFVQGAQNSEDDLAILKAITSLGLDLRMQITAEGVETPEQLAAMRAERCTHVQGYLTGRPMPDGAIASYLAASPTFWQAT